MTEQAGIAIAQIPTGQPLDLFGAVGNLLDAALGGAFLAPGNGRDIAGSIVLANDVTVRDAIGRLRAAARVLSKRSPKVLPEEMPAEVEDPGTIGPITEDEGGLTFRVGGAVDQTREMMRVLLASIIPAFEESEAPNYLEFPAVDETTGKRYAVIVVKPGGLTPHQARQRAEAKVAELRAELERAKPAVSRDQVEKMAAALHDLDCGGPSTGMHHDDHWKAWVGQVEYALEAGGLPIRDGERHGG